MALWRSIIGVIASVFFDIVKQDTRHVVSGARNIVREIIGITFSSSSAIIKGLFASLKNTGNVCATVYNLCGWHVHACKKSAPKRKDEFRTVLEHVFDCFLNNKEYVIKNSDLPTENVRKTEKFGGLKYANSNYFHFFYEFNLYLSSCWLRII